MTWSSKYTQRSRTTELAWPDNCVWPRTSSGTASSPCTYTSIYDRMGQLLLVTVSRTTAYNRWESVCVLWSDRRPGHSHPSRAA